MSTLPRDILEKVNLHGGAFLREDEGFVCMCRFTHKFTIQNDSEWCLECDTQEHKNSMVSEINRELEELGNNMSIFKIDRYGVGEFLCSLGHMSEHDVDEIPNKCKKCPKISHDDIWGSSVSQIRFAHGRETDYEAAYDDSCEFDFANNEDSENSNIYSNGNSDDEAYNSDWFNEWDGAEGDDNEDCDITADVYNMYADNSGDNSGDDSSDMDVDLMFKMMKERQKPKSIFDEYDIDNLPPLILSNEPKIFRYNNVEIDHDHLNLKIYPRVSIPKKRKGILMLTYKPKIPPKKTLSSEDISKIGEIEEIDLL